MPSISDVFKELQQANGRLETLHTDMQDLRSQLLTLHSDLGIVNGSINAGFNNTVNTLNAGFTNMSQGMHAMITLQAFANSVLLYHSKQQDTMICSLEKISNHTCNLVTEAHLQTALLTSIESNEGAQTELLKSVYPDAALQLARAESVRRQMEECCPPEREPPACTYQPCEAHVFDGRAPRIDVPDFEPVVQQPRGPN